jgi:hypothetical protein
VAVYGLPPFLVLNKYYICNIKNNFTMYKLNKKIANSKSFRWGIPLTKYITLGITQKTLKSLYDKGCEFVSKDEKPTKTKSNAKSKAKSDE